MSTEKRKALGRGLSALLPGAPPVAATATSTNSHAQVPAGATVPRRDYFVCAIEDVHPSTHNPRRVFDEKKLEELADSLREHGLVQPLVVRRREGGDGFTLIAGERRWKAAQKAGLKDVPVVIKESTERGAFELALVENLQRADLNPIEEAEAYRRLADDYGYTHEVIAKRVARDRVTVTQTLRLLKLPDPVRGMVSDGRLAMGNARALLGLEDAGAIAKAAEQVVQQGLSTRQTEALVKRLREPPRPTPAPPERSANVKDLESRLRKSVGVPCRLVERAKNAGKLELDYANLDELDRILEKLLRP